MDISNHIVSKIWKNIQRGWQYTASAIGWVISNGNTMSFFYDVWLTNIGTISYIQEPLDEKEGHFSINDLYIIGQWQLHKLSMTLPGSLLNAILDHPMIIKESK